MTKRFVRVYTNDFAVPVGVMKQIPKNSVLRYRPQRVPKFHIPQSIKAELFDMGAGYEYDEDGWNFFATREDFKVHFKKLFGTEVEIVDQVAERDIGFVTLSAYSRAFVNARKVDKSQLRKDPTLGHHPDTYSKKLELVTSVYGESGAKFYLALHDLVIDYIAARI